jgi:hypothetical protein
VDEAFEAAGNIHDGYLAAYDFFSGTTEWSSAPQPPHHAIAITRADVTRDGHDDLIAISHLGVVFVYDVFAQSLVWQSTTLGYGRDVLVEDVDADGSLDIVAVCDDGVFIYGRIAGPLKYVQTASASRHDTGDAVPLDLDGDGDLEIAILLSNRVEMLDHELQPLGEFDLPWKSDTFIVEPSASSHKNLLLARRDDGPSSAIVAVDSRTGAEVWRSPDLIGHVSRSGLHFVTIGGKRQLSFGTSGGMYLTR